MSRELAELSGPALTSTLTAESIIVVPTGSIEHHGPHLPLATDLLLADHVSRATVEAAVAAGLDVWRLPPLGYTKSDEHHWAPGTMWITAETLLATVREIGASVANTPARTLVFLNGHGGNIALLQVALREIRRLTGLHTFLMNVGVDAAPHENGFGIHGGHGETSLLMHVRPDLVDSSLFERAVPDALADLERIKFNGGAVAFGWVSNDFGPSGVIGDPTGSSAEIGKALFDQAVLDGVASLKEIATFPGRLGPGRLA